MTTTAAAPFPVAAGTRLLGEVISWTCAGVAVTHPALVAALADAGLDPAVARELAPRHAFTRACKKLSDQRIIRQVAEDDATLKFQFTHESRDGDRFAYTLETLLTLDKRTGTVTCDLPGLATLAQEHLDHALDARTGGDVTRVIQKLFDRHADLFPVRPQGGATSPRSSTPGSSTRSRSCSAGSTARSCGSRSRPARPRGTGASRTRWRPGWRR